MDSRVVFFRSELCGLCLPDHLSPMRFLKKDGECLCPIVDLCLSVRNHINSDGPCDPKTLIDKLAVLDYRSQNYSTINDVYDGLILALINQAIRDGRDLLEKIDTTYIVIAPCNDHYIVMSDGNSPTKGYISERFDSVEERNRVLIMMLEDCEGAIRKRFPDLTQFSEILDYYYKLRKEDAN